MGAETKKEVAESCFDLLFSEMIEALRVGGKQERSDEVLAETIRGLGYDVGYR